MSFNLIVIYCDVSVLTQSINYSLAADWPPIMQIVRLIAQEHMNNKYISSVFKVN